jgi:hypothetical protein
MSIVRHDRKSLVILSLGLVGLVACTPQNKPIDRYALVKRNNPVLTSPDTLGSLSIGNGRFAFTVDASGLQTFVKEYENGIPLGTQAEWAWHSMPTAEGYTLKEVADPFESCDGTSAEYPVQQREGRRGEATNYLRANPHRLHLGILGLLITKKNGEEIRLGDLMNLRQELDLWTGKIETTYEIEGIPVRVQVAAHPRTDEIAARIESALVAEGRIKVRIVFPYPKDCHVCPGYDLQASDESHKTTFSSTKFPPSGSVVRQVDSSIYSVGLMWNNASARQARQHEILITPDSASASFEFAAGFGAWSAHMMPFKAVAAESAATWKDFWTMGGAMDFSECTDPRARELERRVVLSQYLTKIQCAGSMPPQETGLTMNSWYGKFHLEMYQWHGAHFAQWNRPELLAQTMSWLDKTKSKAAATATWQGYDGLRWQKMTDPEGNESPSSVGAFIIWQQPHPIFLSEMLYRAKPGDSILNKYKDIVFGTADFMASFVKRSDGVYHLCHPLIPAQEIFKATETDDPTYELQYWHYGLQVAQQWRHRLGLAPNEKWQAVIDNLAPLPLLDGLYLPTATSPEAYVDDDFRRDHPSVLAALGFIPFNNRLDTAAMRRTLDNILQKWNWESTWGWDYPMIAMTAARLNQPEKAIEALLMDTPKNIYLVNGHNYQDKRLRLYLPGNGGVLSAVALMAAGWEWNTVANPGFPKDGRWDVRWEGLAPLP